MFLLLENWTFWTLEGHWATGKEDPSYKSGVSQTPKSRPYPDMVKNLDIMVFVLRDKDTMLRTLLITFDLCQLLRPGVICLYSKISGTLFTLTKNSLAFGQIWASRIEKGQDYGIYEMPTKKTVSLKTLSK